MRAISLIFVTPGLPKRKQLQLEKKENHKKRRQTSFTKTVDVQYEVVVSMLLEQWIPRIA